MLTQDRDGRWSHHGIAYDQCEIVFNGLSSIGVYQVYRPDGLFAKVVGTFAVEETAKAYCAAEGWEVRR